MQQAEQLKINVSNIRSSLLIGTKRTQVLKIRKEKIIRGYRAEEISRTRGKKFRTNKKTKEDWCIKISC